MGEKKYYQEMTSGLKLTLVLLLPGYLRYSVACLPLHLHRHTPCKLPHADISVKTHVVDEQHPGDQVASQGPGTEQTSMLW